MRPFLQRILVASHWGASLVLAAGCGSSISGGNGGSGGSTSTTGTLPDGGTWVDDLDPLPTPACVGPFYGDDIYYGQCCDEIVCYASTDGFCLSPEDARPTLSGLPPGSGSCECAYLRGPYEGGADAGDKTCCYLVGAVSCEGRPLTVEGEIRLSDVISGPSMWSSPPPDRDATRRELTAALAQLDTTSLSASDRERLARCWADRARYEHASVASFGRFSVALMALAAPPDLVEAAHRAAIDEIDHARLCLAIASTYARAPFGLGALPVEGAFADLGSLEAAAVATVVEGCVGETLAAIEAAATAAQAGPRAVRLALTAIAEDEARHAELAWAFVRWALGTGDASLAVSVRAAFEAAMRKATSGDDIRSEAMPIAHGFLPAADIARLRRRAFAEVIRPAVAALLAARPANALRAA